MLNGRSDSPFWIFFHRILCGLNPIVVLLLSFSKLQDENGERDLLFTVTNEDFTVGRIFVNCEGANHM